MAFKSILQSIGVVEKDEPGIKDKPKVNASMPEAPRKITVDDVRGIGEPQPSVPFSSETLEAHMEQEIQANPAFAPALIFLAAADAIKGVIAEEGLRFRTAQATTKIAPDVLILALQAHDESLQYEARMFEGAVVSPTVDRINLLTAKSGALQSQIDALQQQITELAAQKDQANAEIITSNSDLDKAKIDFKATQSKVGQRYSDLAKKVSQYLGS